MAADIVPGPGWSALRERVTGGTAMVIGTGGSGKTHLARYLLARRGPQRAALISADPGQPSLGVPACLALGSRAPWLTPSALWFIGDTSPVGNLLPVVVGTARLAARARTAGAELLVIDTSGLVEGPLGRLLKYHKALAVGVDHLVVLQHARELEPVIELLAGVCARVHRVSPAAVAQDRSREERRAYREGRFRAHLRGARLLRFSARRVIRADWSLGLATGDAPPPGTLVGLLDAAGFCLRVGLVRRAGAGTIEVSARWGEPRAVRGLQLGRLRVTAGGAEAR